jgi:hypothetical protein
VDHDVRWDLPLPDRKATFDYLRARAQRRGHVLRPAQRLS